MENGRVLSAPSLHRESTDSLINGIQPLILCISNAQCRSAAYSSFLQCMLMALNKCKYNFLRINLHSDTFLPTSDSTYFTSERFGEGSGPILIDYITCNGSESALWLPRYYSEKYCSTFTHYYGCSHSDDVGVRCQPGIKIWRAIYSSEVEHHFLIFI